MSKAVIRGAGCFIIGVGIAILTPDDPRALIGMVVIFAGGYLFLEGRK